ncbi:invasion associated locus B family protein [Ochrobactrum quorumnocens]|nr:invasion associated locus B family protein [[Ochrobactrum] quorumnocens]
MPSSFNVIAHFVAALFFFNSAASGLAQESASTSAASPPPAWSLACASPNAATGPLTCQIEQRFFRQQTRELVMILAISKTSVNQDVAINLVLPHGLRIPNGVSYQVDTGAVETAAIVSSGPNGAITSIPVSPDFLAGLKSGTTLSVKVQTTSGTELSIPVSLAGFTAAIDRMSAIR